MFYGYKEKLINLLKAEGINTETPDVREYIDKVEKRKIVN